MSRTINATPPAFPVHRLSVEQYHRMIAENILNETDDLELIEGLLVPKMTREPPHDATLDRLEDQIRGLLPGGCGWRLRGQKAITLSDSEPEPDVAVVVAPAHRYYDHHPEPSEIALIAEVSESSLQLDRTAKLRTYAKNGIAVYWIVNLEDGQVEVYTDPVSPPNADPRYRTRTDYRPGQDVPLVVAGTQFGAIPVDAILP